MAIRADSIWRLVTYAGSRAWIPKSPKAIRVPPVAAPERGGWCCLRCLTRRGINMSGLRPARVGSRLRSRGARDRLGYDGLRYDGLGHGLRRGLGYRLGDGLRGRRSVGGRTAPAARTLGPLSTVGPRTARRARRSGLL